MISEVKSISDLANTDNNSASFIFSYQRRGIIIQVK